MKQNKSVTDGSVGLQVKLQFHSPGRDGTNYHLIRPSFLTHHKWQKSKKERWRGVKGAFRHRYLVGWKHATGGWVNITKVDLDGGLVLCADETVGRRALSWDVKINYAAFVVLHFELENPNLNRRIGYPYGTLLHPYTPVQAICNRISTFCTQQKGIEDRNAFADGLVRG